MKLADSIEVQGTPLEVFERLLDPALLARCLPGCERMEQREPGEYAVLLRAGVGPMKGRFEGTVRVTGAVPGEGYRLDVEGKSAMGHVAGGADFKLSATGTGTRIAYEGEARVSGRMAQVGGRLVDAAARAIARRFFANAARELANSA